MMMTAGTRRSGARKKAAPARHAMRRTTSMTEFAPPEVLAHVAEEEEKAAEETELQAPDEEAEDWLVAYRARAAPAGHRRNSVDLSAVETAAFLRACGLCNRRLGPGVDTFMYRGDAAFCSQECRQQHITREEWEEKKSALATPKPMAPVMADTVAPASAAGSDMPTLAAA